MSPPPPKKKILKHSPPQSLHLAGKQMHLSVEAAVGAGNHAFKTPTTGEAGDRGDLYLIHGPETEAHSWTVMEELHANEMLGTIGVSNYSPRHLTELLETCRMHPAVLQVEFHPRLAQRELRTICRHSGVCFQAYSSLGKGTLLPNHKLWLWRKGMAELPPRSSCSGPLSRVWLCYPGLHGSRG
uniref:Zgc:110782 n=1 Tax=Oncorhynchus kisutch TaxID=8019 RepID=A0A8C7KH17_ONCKI